MSQETLQNLQIDRIGNPQFIRVGSKDIRVIVKGKPVR